MAAPMESQDDKAEDVFGNSSLFEEFGTTILSCKHRRETKAPEWDSEKKVLTEEINKLKQENQRLRSWLKVCIQAKGYKVAESKQDGPVAQVVYMNHSSVSKYRHEVENFFEHLCHRSLHQKAVATGNKTQLDDVTPLPQRSSMVLTENPDPATREAFTATGNVQYYMSFCLDSMGRPLLDGNAQLTEGWEIPPYLPVFREVLPIDEKPSAPSRGGRAKAACFNCGNEKHSLRECPLPRDLVRISENKRLFMSTASSPAQTISGRRYHADREMSEKFKQFKPGVIGDTLREALGISAHQLPPYIYMMRRFGYPPGHLLEAQVQQSKLKVYNIQDTDEEGELTGEDTEEDGRPRFNLKKLIDFPGFNVYPGDRIRDDWRQYNSMPMQASHSKEHMEHLLRPMAVEEEDLATPLKKRRNADFLENSGSNKKRQRTEEETVDMDVEADDASSSTPCRGWFQPPLPPTPEMSTPPPLPPGPAPPTPGRTPDKDIHSIPSLDDSLPWRSKTDGWLTARRDSQTSSRSGSPDLEGLMRERTKLLAALNTQEGSTASSSDAFLSGVDTNEEEEDGEAAARKTRERRAKNLTKLSDASSADENGQTQSANDESNTNTRKNNGRTQSVDGTVSIKESPDSPDLVAEGQESIDSSLPDTLDLTEGDSSVIISQDEEVDDEERPNRSGVPHRRKFSANISPHVFDVEEPQKRGIFKKLLGILKRDKS
ncbi:zinc finger CCHC domain-containing protein 8-like [Diadema antillarum]|uniref:zinc finger CCHC domain-containing protein 8-like n=1 Tax=Diadema antillarum TaxID=105358 RepID=UPI003A8C7CBB